MTAFTSNDYLKILQLSKIEGIGVNKLRTLVSNFSSLHDVFDADFTELNSIEGINSTISKRILREAEENNFLPFAERQILLSEKNKTQIISFWDEDYPYLLRKIYDPPVIIFAKGNFEKSDENAIAVVGTRTPTSYGNKSTEKLVSDLVSYNITIVSGLARGIDTTAHYSALKHGGRTISVLGSGLDIIYPPENKKLFDKITESGCVISEYSFGTKPDAMNFPRRNRIISGLSLGTIVIETDFNGGARLTAQFALDQNREVFALPGPVETKQSRGTNQLIQRGHAKLITSVDDVISEFGNKFRIQSKEEKRIDTSQLNIFESKLFELIDTNPIHIDSLAERAESQTSECLVHLLTLEFKGLIKQLPGKYFIRE
ncbi:MAG: DNA-protecting protein DprA [Ignavibacteria bacterium]|nr:DNA-protecting protein DprA [Ignavibacteria bacterium]